MRAKILVTGGAGYIGSHTVLQLLELGYSVSVLDDLSNSSCRMLKTVEQLAGADIHFIEGSVLDSALLDSVLSEQTFAGVIHLAARKSVSDSVTQPIDYYMTNVAGTLNLCQAMQRHGLFKLIFSSSAAVYGETATSPLTEDACIALPASPYGKTKLMVEQVLADLCSADPRWNVTLLRYFNPAGAHPSGKIGEAPRQFPTNLMPLMCRAAEQGDSLQVFGGDYPTRDGTGIRDYIHIQDLVSGHIKALQRMLLPSKNVGISVYNLGTGEGYTVKEVLAAFERVNGVRVAYQIVSRRQGDTGQSWADPGKAKQELGWSAQYSLDDMCRDEWNWYKYQLTL